MKANELMRENLVFFNGKPCKVTKINADTVCLSYLNKNRVALSVPVERIFPIPLSHEILAKICSFEEHHPGTSATEEVTYYIIDRLKIKHNTEDWRHEYFCVEGIPYKLEWLHQLQQIFTICGIEKEIALDGVIVDIPLEPLP